MKLTAPDALRQGTASTMPTTTFPCLRTPLKKTFHGTLPFNSCMVSSACSYSNKCCFLTSFKLLLEKGGIQSAKSARVFGFGLPWRALSRLGFAMATVGKNRNARRSVSLLREAFAELMAEQPYDKITVTAVTQRAGLNRGTFYAHYDSIDDLLGDLVHDLTAEVSQLIDQVLTENFLQDPMPVIHQIGSYLDARHELFSKLTRSTSVSSFVDSLMRMFRDKVSAHLASMGRKDVPADLVAADFMANAVVGTFRSWLRGEYGEMPVAQVEARVSSLLLTITSSLE